MPITCDPHLLPASDWDFVVVADTHYFADPDHADADAVAEFPSRRVQGERAAAVWQTIADLDPAFIVHMGDLVQEYPGRPDFDRAQQEALAQIDAVGLRDRIHFVAGNHDVGDKPDPTMPTHAVTEQDLTVHEVRFGSTYAQWQHGGLRFASLNSQILNTNLPAAGQQQAWLEELLNEDDDNLILFLHLPLYLRDAQDPHLGHYDTVAEPARGDLLRRLRHSSLQHLFAAHVHFRFYDRFGVRDGVAQHWICASSCFTRPGFGQLFAAPPAPERGRDDTPKLGFYLCRVRAGKLDVHFVPTGDGRSTHRRALTVNSGADRQRLGITLTQPLVSQAQVPIAYPSLVRQPVRNDYPWLLLREVGAGLVRVPCEDLGDSTQQSRLQWLRQDGLQLQAVAVGLGAAAQTAVAHADAFDRLEVQLTDGPVPNAQQLQQLGELDSPLALCAIVPGDHIAGKQHPRTRVGYRANELVQLLPIVSECGPDVAMVMCAEVQQALTPAALIAPAELPLQLRLSLDDEATAPTWITRALIQAAAWQAPLFVEPLIDLDRTMDGASGLLDPLCNPRRAFETARVLTALLEHVRPERFEVGPVQERIQMSGASAHLTVWPSGAVDETSAGRWFDLSSGSVSQRQMPVEGRGPVALLQ
ncbi:MAG: hypothetical protein HOM68_02445 [Gemmatimonadetes bacterium]|mgnify:CR=1 FL=1|jgi:UDP-2,3-diacylglucosamine pyrophosphatase LpxH|nr:hypothetical protein [Gemmatimonadota bacterium]MBT5055376.1 hypothetical protein [Gemmatimonadota bacterium]MBT5144979.1 hypothetical protein [Gemmatimonadota bacterium]MBT5588937.1 hypothetical protein [Gemmatimonadota bacterium]MBT5963774.1 hypothetical protein [Gemmatimonadota bacterium]